MIIKPKGDVTIFEIGALCGELKAAVASAQPIELDLSEVVKCDASALQLFIAAYRTSHINVTGLTESIRGCMAELGHHS
ncbi:MAG: hypothetical protein AMXMBFR67_36340 [Nitrospira sp.]|nr:MAG: hypothetical protein DCC63_17195 [Nitrospira sp.]